MLKPIYNSAYSILQRTWHYNPFIPKKINGVLVAKGHARFEQESDPQLDRNIIAEIKKAGIGFSEYVIDIQAFRKYFSETVYPKNYYGNGKTHTPNFIEKALEHFVALQLLDLNEKSVVVDVGACNSPFFELVMQKTSCKNAYAQDLDLPNGMNGKYIGGKASELPFEDSSVDAITLHCALEHFEGMQDLGFFKEASRVLKKNGKCIVLPLYLSSQYTIHLDPVNNLLKSLKPELNDEGAVIKYCDSRQPFSRHYDVKTFSKRILNQVPLLDAEIMHVSNFFTVSDECYLRFIGVFTKQ